MSVSLTVVEQLQEALVVKLKLVGQASKFAVARCTVETVQTHVAPRPGSKPAAHAVVKSVEVTASDVAVIQNMPPGRNFLICGVAELLDGEALRSEWIATWTRPYEDNDGRDSVDLHGASRGQCTKCPCKAFRLAHAQPQWAASGAAPGMCRGCGCNAAQHVETNGQLAHESSLKTPEGKRLADEIFRYSGGRCRPADMARLRHIEKPPPRGREDFERCRVSVVCPTWDKRHNFHEQLWTVFDAQTWPDKELIIVETYVDHPSPFFQEKAKQDERIVYVTYKVEPDADWTIGLKRNICAFLASGTVLASFDDDDLYAPEYLTTMVRHMVENLCEAVTLSSWYVCDTETGTFGCVDARGIGSLTPAAKLFGYGFSYVMLRTMVMMYPYPYDMNLGEDTELFRRIMNQLGPSIFGGARHACTYPDRQGICCHTLHPGATSTSWAQYLLGEDEIEDLDVADLACWQDYRKLFPVNGKVSEYIGQSGRPRRKLIVWSNSDQVELKISPLAKCRTAKEKLAKKTGAASAAEMELHSSRPAPGRKPIPDRQRLEAQIEEVWVHPPFLTDRELRLRELTKAGAPALSYDRFCEFCMRLLSAFSEESFQVKIHEAYRESSEKPIEFMRKKQAICLPIQIPVLEEFGFEPSKRGLQHSTSLFAIMSQGDSGPLHMVGMFNLMAITPSMQAQWQERERRDMASNDSLTHGRSQREAERSDADG